MKTRIVLALPVILLPGAAAAEETHVQAEEPAAAGVTDYCANFADRASEARVAWQDAELKKLEKQIDGKIAELGKRREELQSWVEKREAMLKAAGKELVDIYAKMDVEAASAQLAQLDTEVATSVLRQLSPRAASAILAGMDSKKAALLARAIATSVIVPAKDGGT